MGSAMLLMLVQQQQRTDSPMLDKDTSAGRGGPMYAFNIHRDALYKILESAVREKGSEGDKDNHGSWSIPPKDVGQALSYPTPILWFEDMRPADLDAYHAANRRRGRGVDDVSVHGARSDQRGGDFNRSSSASKNYAAVVEGATAVVGGRPTQPETIQDRLVSNYGTNITSRPAAAAEKDVLREMTPQPLPPSGASATFKTCSTGEAATPKRALDDIIGVQLASAEEPSTAAADTDIDGASFSKPFEDAGYCPFKMTPTMTQPGPSQTTQTMFLPGLPSQVLMTQQRGDADEWGHAEADESQQEEGFLSSPCSSLGGDALKGVSPESAGSSPPLSMGPSAARNLPSRDHHGHGGEAGRAAAVAGTRGQEEARSRQNEGFIRALRELVEQGRPSSAGIESGVGQSASLNVGGGDSGSGSGDRRGPPRFTFVPTQEVLPSDWLGGQAEAVAFLEDRLTHARKRAPDGYAIRALELACHVLRQPAVCVKATGRSVGASMRREKVLLPRVDEDRPEVVGISGFVWQLLGVGARDTGRKPAPSTSQR